MNRSASSATLLPVPLPRLFLLQKWYFLWNEETIFSRRTREYPGISIVIFWSRIGWSTMKMLHFAVPDPCSWSWYSIDVVVGSRLRIYLVYICIYNNIIYYYIYISILFFWNEKYAKKIVLMGVFAHRRRPLTPCSETQRFIYLPECWPFFLRGQQIS